MARIWMMLRFSGSDFGHGAGCRGPDAIRRMLEDQPHGQHLSRKDGISSKSEP